MEEEAWVFFIKREPYIIRYIEEQHLASSTLLRVLPQIVDAVSLLPSGLLQVSHLRFAACRFIHLSIGQVWLELS